MSWFKPNTFKGELGNFKVWFPKLEPNDSGWIDRFDGNEIISKNDKEEGKAEEGQKNITFVYKEKEYTFAGIFKLDHIDADGTEHWKKIDDKCPVINRQNKSSVAAMLCLLFLAMLTASPGYADANKDLGDFKKSQYCGDDVCPEYGSYDFLVCLNRVESDCGKKFVNEKKDKKDKIILCSIEGGKKCKKTIDDALADSGEVEKIIPGIKNWFSILFDSFAKLEEEKKKVEKDPDMMQAKKEKQLELLEQKEQKLNEEGTKIAQQILNTTITLKGVYVHDFYEDWRRVPNDIPVKKTDHIIHHGGKSEKDLYHHIGRYAKQPFKAVIIVNEKFAQEADRGIYDITGTIAKIETNSSDEYGQAVFVLYIQLKSAKYVGKK